MNKRIRELYDQSIVVRNDDAQWIEDELDPEKFAELIVRECANVAYEYDLPKMSGPGMIIGGRIETHFGVEE